MGLTPNSFDAIYKRMPINTSHGLKIITNMLNFDSICVEVFSQFSIEIMWS